MNSNRSGNRPSSRRSRERDRDPPLPGTDELRACVALQKEIWNFTDAELVPLRMFVVAEKSRRAGDGRFRRWRDGRLRALGTGGAVGPHLSSLAHAGRAQGYRNGGLGRRLKLLQREDALARGIELIEWTFDPLEIKNAYLNIEKLGAIARRYNINQYGITSSPLQGGLPSDRLIAEWWLKSKRVETLLATGKNPVFTQQAAIEVPAQIYEWKSAAETRNQAQQVQENNREQFLAGIRQRPRRAGLRARFRRQRQVPARRVGRDVVVRVGRGQYLVPST
jgi:predicted GNAT superfamily acetyltransferase